MRSKIWWDAFWKDSSKSYGAPNETILSFAKNFIYERNGLTAVDIASGNGRYAIELAKMGYKVDALDLSDLGLQRTSATAKGLGVKINTIQGDFIEMCHEKRYYDLVLSSGLLEEIDMEFHESVIRGFIDWTAPDGLNIIKYCLEISGRDQLVGDNFVPPFYTNAGWEILLLKENTSLHKSNASIEFPGKIDSKIRTGTVIAQKPL